MTPRALALVLFVAVAVAPSAAPAAPPPEVAVSGSRIHLGDVAPAATGEQAAVDLGATPAMGGARLLTRADIMRALDVKKLAAPAKVPAAVRVVRKVKHLSPAELEALVRETASGQSLGRGVTLAGVHARHALDVPEGWSRLNVEVPRAPKKAGGFSASAALSFLGAGDEVLVRALVPIDLVVSEDGARYDAPRGAPVTLVVRQNFVEIRASGVTEADADIGDPVPVQLGVSGRVIHARLLSGDEALAEDRP